LSNRVGHAGFSAIAITDLLPQIGAAYLENWAREFAKPEYSRFDGNGGFKGEPPAKAAAKMLSFLLDQGISRKYLSAWLGYRVKYAEESIDLSTFMDHLDQMYSRGRGPVRGLALLSSPPPPFAIERGSWLKASAARAWIQEKGTNPPKTIHGGLLFELNVWDIHSAVDQIRDAIEGLKFRVKVATGKDVKFYNRVWLEGVSGPRTLADRSRLPTPVPAYAMSGDPVDRPGSANRIEVAIDFLRSATLTSRPTGAGSLWAALESLLVSPGDEHRGVAVVERATNIGVVAFVRHQVQFCIGYLRANASDESMVASLSELEGVLAVDRLQQMAEGSSDRPLASLLAEIELQHVADLCSPVGLRALRSAIEGILFGLYRQRNLVLHGGVTDAPMLEPLVRDCMALVSAIANRFVRQCRLDPSLSPLLLAYRDGILVEEAVEAPVKLSRYMTP
jgi:hypothetical protein